MVMTPRYCNWRLLKLILHQCVNLHQGHINNFQQTMWATEKILTFLGITRTVWEKWHVLPFGVDFVFRELDWFIRHSKRDQDMRLRSEMLLYSFPTAATLPPSWKIDYFPPTSIKPKDSNMKTLWKMKAANAKGGETPCTEYQFSLI